MVILFNENDLVSFGTFLLSKERKEMYVPKEGVEMPDLSEVTEADIEAWLFLEKQKSNG